MKNINKTGQKSRTRARKSITTEIITPAVIEILNGLQIGECYKPEFGWFERTGNKEITMVMLIESRHFKAESFIEKLKQIVESHGWVVKYLVPMRYSSIIE